MHEVTSADGTRLAVETAGSGPVVVLVGGAFNDRTTVAALAGELTGRTTVRYDRRGRGDSGDTPPYAVEREFEDLRAVVADAGGEATLFGHSSGAALVLRAVAAGVPATAVVAYEPPWTGHPADLADRVEAADDPVTRFLTDAAGVPAPVVEQLRGSAEWAWFERFAASLPYDVRQTGTGVPAAELARIAVPALVVDGAESPAPMRAAAAAAAAAIPGARHESLPGEDHGVLRRPAALVPLLHRFLSGVNSM